MGFLMPIDLKSPTDRQTLAEQIEADIDSYCQSIYDSEHRNHLGASMMGKPCWRQLWYVFRWVKREKHDGRKLRLFNVGHTAEPRFISYLKGIGFEVKEHSDEGKQWRISGANGHYGGSLDGMCKAPARYEITEDLILLNEFKTNGTGSGYAKVAEQDLVKAKPEHYAQMSQYGYKYGLRYGLYLIENKNDSDITVKIVELDWQLGKQLEQKAEEIISSKEPLNRISDNPAFQECKQCHFIGICHSNETPERNCRSCRNASPVENGQWQCSLYGIVPESFIKTGCENDWLPI
jgi:hypothetical protein